MPATVEVIQYDFFASRFGPGLIAGTDAGICQAAFTDSPHAELISELQRQFPAARLEHRPGRYADVCRQMFSEDASDCDLDMYGSQFQLRVWSELRRVPTGETISYQQLARRLGAPRATRAVASAVARNRIAYLVPCHRVIRADGSLGGYRWGKPSASPRFLNGKPPCR